jgi:hypothetical protein
MATEKLEKNRREKDWDAQDASPKIRHPKEPGERSDGVTRHIQEGAQPLTGGADRREHTHGK